MSGLEELCRTLEAVNRDAESLAAELGQRAERLAQSATRAASIGTGSKRVEGAQTAQALQAASRSAQQAAQLLHRVAMRGRGFVARHGGTDASPRTGNERAISDAPISGPSECEEQHVHLSAEAISLLSTNQVYHRVMFGNQALNVFDHPEESAHSAVFNQGTANPKAFRGTCGLCAVATILRMAGVGTNEAAITTYASRHGLCMTNRADPAENGGTSSAQLVSIFRGYANMSAHDDIGKPLEELAAAVEQGRGVIIGINPTLLNPDWYGEFNPNANPGHWVVLQSVMRDASTGEILGLYIFDSNGKTAAETCQLYSISKLQMVYSRWGSRSVETDVIIW